MVVFLFLVFALCCIAVEVLRQVLLRRREMRRAAEALLRPGPARLLPSLLAHELPGGLFFHSGHTWAKLEPSGAVQVGLDGFAREIVGRIDSVDLPGKGTRVRQGEPVFAAVQSGKRIEFVSPVDGVVSAVNDEINAGLEEARKDPYEKGWTLSIRPSNLVKNLDRLRIGEEAAAWLDGEVRRFSQFLSLHRPVVQEVGLTLPDGGIHAEGILESMEGEILQTAVRKFFR